MNTSRPGPALYATLGALYFAQALPVSMLGKALPALARDAGLPTEWIGFLALPALPWALKFIWAPWVDRWGAGRPNHRKRWIQGCLVAVMAVLFVVSLFPQKWLLGPGFVLLLGLLFLLNLFSATQDIATDGLATRLLPPDLRGLGNSIQVNGYKIGMMVGSSALLILVGWWGWQTTLGLVIAGMMMVLVQVTRFQEPVEPIVVRERASFRWWRQELVRFWRRPGMGLWLFLLLFYKVGDGFGTRMINPFLVDNAWTLVEIGTLELVISFAGLAGAAMAGLLMIRMRHRTALFVFALLQTLAFSGWAFLAHYNAMDWVWPVALFEQFTDGLSTVAFFTLMMDYCRDGHEGSDYTMQASVRLFAVGVFTLGSGFSAAWLGYDGHFLLAAVLVAIVIPLAWRWQPPGLVAHR
ncbi:MFS transporter [Alcanivorax sp. DP30]|uniref:MFS transporter n=1 Tax=Alcanivorax sp. DP30 TaxID=2606217 RepID=UPI00136E8F59|nr:MFS transporter [Alcanivorax sp. DP30]MZR61515.1 MFS transporter [Alcanivorax sp. DP30]